MTISGIRRIGLATGVLVVCQGVAVAQVQMRFPDMGSGTIQRSHVRQLNVRQLHVRPLSQPPQRTLANVPGAVNSAGSRVPPVVARDSHRSHGNAFSGGSSRGFSGSVHVNSDLGLTHNSAAVLDHRVHEVHERLLHNGHEFPVHLPSYGWGYYGYGNRYGFGYPYLNSYYDYIDGSYYEPQYSAQPQLPPPAPEPVEPLTDEEIAAIELRDGKAGRAVDLYRKILRDEPQDAASMRGLALALLKDVRFEEGVAMMAMAYRTDALLADESLSVDLFKDDVALRELLLKCVMHANKTKLGSAWLTVAVLMQAEERDDRALRMVKKASDAGLDIEVVDSLTRALGG